MPIRPEARMAPVTEGSRDEAGSAASGQRSRIFPTLPGTSSDYGHLPVLFAGRRRAAFGSRQSRLFPGVRSGGAGQLAEGAPAGPFCAGTPARQGIAMARHDATEHPANVPGNHILHRAESRMAAPFGSAPACRKSSNRRSARRRPPAMVRETPAPDRRWTLAADRRFHRSRSRRPFAGSRNVDRLGVRQQAGAQLPPAVPPPSPQNRSRRAH